MCSTVVILGQGERALRGEEQWTCCNSIKKQPQNKLSFRFLELVCIWPIFKGMKVYQNVVYTSLSQRTEANVLSILGYAFITDYNIDTLHVPWCCRLHVEFSVGGVLIRGQ